MLELTITGNQKVRLDSQYKLVAGYDRQNVPRILRTDPDGRLTLGGADLPQYDKWTVDRYGATNNIHHIIYFLAGVEVARWTFLYVGGGAANDDDFASGELVLA